jgi:hypothetical protein
MGIDNMNKIQELWASYARNEISLADFQSRLRPILGDFTERTKEDDEFINKVDNDLEMIVYTLPEEQQKNAAASLLPSIHRYFDSKS